MTLVDKNSLILEIDKVLQDRLKILIESAFEAKEASTNEESKAENKYDTRGLEAGYLASGQAMRAQKLQEQIYQLSKVTVKEFDSDSVIELSALVEVEVDGEKKMLLFLLPIGGVDIDMGNSKIQTITLQTPLGQNLMDQKVGHEFEINGKEYEILGLQ